MNACWLRAGSDSSMQLKAGMLLKSEHEDLRNSRNIPYLSKNVFGFPGVGSRSIRTILALLTRPNSIPDFGTFSTCIFGPVLKTLNPEMEGLTR